MSKMTKAQARKRLNECKMKLVKVGWWTGSLWSPRDLSEIQKMADKCERLASKLK